MTLLAIENIHTRYDCTHANFIGLDIHFYLYFRTTSETCFISILFKTGSFTTKKQQNEQFTLPIDLVFLTIRSYVARIDDDYIRFDDDCHVLLLDGLVHGAKVNWHVGNYCQHNCAAHKLWIFCTWTVATIVTATACQTTTHNICTNNVHNGPATLICHWIDRVTVFN